jgi:hypothetical protein
VEVDHLGHEDDRRQRVDAAKHRSQPTGSR